MSGTVTFNHSPLTLSGVFPSAGQSLPAFNLTGTDLQQYSSDYYAGKKLLVYIFPSVDTSVCAASLAKINVLADSRSDLCALAVSADLPFAQQRFSQNKGLSNVMMLSSFRNRDFSVSYGVAIASGPLEGLCARGVILADASGRILHSQLVPELTAEPDYEALIATLGS